jgi:putative ABC transport system permease protein
VHSRVKQVAAGGFAFGGSAKSITLQYRRFKCGWEYPIDFGMLEMMQIKNCKGRYLVNLLKILLIRCS